MVLFVLCDCNIGVFAVKAVDKQNKQSEGVASSFTKCNHHLSVLPGREIIMCCGPECARRQPYSQSNDSTSLSHSFMNTLLKYLLNSLLTFPPLLALAWWSSLTLFVIRNSPLCQQVVSMSSPADRGGFSGGYLIYNRLVPPFNYIDFHEVLCQTDFIICNGEASYNGILMYCYL